MKKTENAIQQIARVQNEVIEELDRWKRHGTWGDGEMKFTKEELRVQRQIAELANEYDVSCSDVIHMGGNRYIVVKDGESFYI